MEVGRGKVEGEDVASLSRADWRFLLPRPAGGRFAHLVLLGTGVGERELVERLGLADRVSASLAGDAMADTIVARAGADVSVAEIGARLSGGGALHLEVQRRSAGELARSPARVRAELAAAGLTTIGTYLPVGGLADPRALVPLDDVAPLSWYLDIVARAPSAMAMLSEAALRAALTAGIGAVEAIVPSFIVVAVRPATAVARRGNRLPAVLDGAPGLEASATAPRTLLMVQGGDRVVALPFPPGARAPEIAVKVPRAPELSERTEVDQRTIADLHARLPAMMADAIPRPLGMVRSNGVTVASESVMRGSTLLHSSGRRGVSAEARLADLRRAAAWLAELHLATETRRERWSGAGAADWLERPAAAYEAAFALTDDERALLDRARAYGAAHASAELPIVLAHRDYNPWNILRDGDAIGVVDWEGARPGPALVDLLQLATNWHDAAHGALDEAAKLTRFEELMFGEGRAPLARGARAVLGDYLRRMRMDPALVPPLVLYSWMELALRREEQRVAHRSRAAADARLGNRAVGFIALLAVKRESLFGGAGGWWSMAR